MGIAQKERFPLEILTGAGFGGAWIRTQRWQIRFGRSL
jgi:hypothetical protein